MSRLIACLLAPAALLAGAATTDDSDVPAARITGEPVSCIPANGFTDTRVRNGTTIDFMRNSRQGWRNTLTFACSGLATQRAITYRVTGNQLCDVDIVNVLETAGGLQRGTPCSLGKFVPIELEKR